MWLLYRTLGAISALCLGFVGPLAFADETPYTEGNVVNVAAIRTEYGRFDDYMKFVATTWKQQMEASKKAGLIVSYEVLAAQPHNPAEADIYLVVRYKNWAALDGLREKQQAILAQIYGSLTKASQGAVERGKLRTVLGDQNLQVLNLK